MNKSDTRKAARLDLKKLKQSRIPRIATKSEFEFRRQQKCINLGVNYKRSNKTFVGRHAE